MRPRLDLPNGVRRALPLAAGVLLAACGGGSTGTAPAADGQPPAEVAWVRDTMADAYLYAERMPAADLAGLTTAEATLERLRVNPPDRFSYVERKQVYDQFFDEGRALGLGIGYRIVGETIVLRFVQPDSPAGRAGLLRGERITAIDGVPAATLIARAGVGDALGPSEPGVTVKLDVARAGSPLQVTLTKDWYTVQPVLAHRVIDHQGERIGYVMLYTFTEPARAAWQNALAALQAGGATSIVVDLRENGGGRLYVAAEIAASLAPGGTAGEVFTWLRYNARHRADDLAVKLPANPAAGRFARVAWITSASTCSASEALVKGLEPWRATPAVGETTCGKPVGFNPVSSGDKVLNAVGFSVTNRDGATGWFDGLAPVCSVGAEPFLPYGDPADPRLAEALQLVTTGACSAAASGPQAKAAVTPTPAGPQPPERGLASQTGLR